MAVAETGAIFNSLLFGGVRSTDYGIYITGEAVYNAPVRAVEMVSVPGRNGAIAIDQGYWENVEVKYPAGCFGTTQTEFAEAIASFRNAILSQLGYQRLTDTYHPEEYRMATYISGLEVSPVNNSVAGEFELVFNCKPQRWLTAGERPVTIGASGASIGNPTLYDASPMLEVEGYGTLTVNGYEIEITDDDLGEVELFERATANNNTVTASVYADCTFDRSYVNSGDTITMNTSKVVVNSTPYYASLGANLYFAYPLSATADNTAHSDTNLSYSSYGYGTDSGSTKYLTLSLYMNGATFTAGTASTVTGSSVVTFDVTYNGSTTSCQVTGTLTLSYDGDSTIRATITRTIGTDPSSLLSIYPRAWMNISKAVANSTVSILGTPTYVDCDLGVCYKIENDTVVDLNPYIDLGSDLPVLSAGNNTITYDNTITGVDIVPRWWQL